MYLSGLEKKQLSMLKHKKPAARFALMLDLIGVQIEAMKAGIKYLNPRMGVKELDKCLKERIRKTYLLKH
jgi:hypothetical protein